MTLTVLSVAFVVAALLVALSIAQTITVSLNAFLAVLP